MLALGMFVFIRQTAPYQSLQRVADYSWAANSRIGKRKAYQFLGPGDDKITLTGELHPEVTPGGRLSLLTLYAMAAQGRAWPLISGNGMIYGMFVVSNVQDTGTVFYADGTPRKITFTLTLTRVDESLTSMFGDIHEQAKTLLGQAGDLLPKIGGQ
jgi:phage protein U